MGGYSRQEAAERAGVAVDEVTSLVEWGILVPDDNDCFSSGDVNRIVLIGSLVAAGIPLDGMAARLRSGDWSLAFLDSPSYDRFAALAGETFQELSNRTGVPVGLLTGIREAIGGAVPMPADRVLEDELAIVPLLELLFETGFDEAFIGRTMGAMGDSLRRVAEVVVAMAREESFQRRMTGKTGAEFSAALVGFVERLGPLTDQALASIFHAQIRRTLTNGMIGGLERALAAAGLSSRLERPPAMCFLDITGYTRLTEERGDAAAADLAAQLGRLVQRTSLEHGGRPVKWLGDGVMLYFRDPGPGVVAALEMVAGVAEAGLPPAHVGLHAGPVVFQQGDYYGQTVNIASRIAEYARQGEVVVSQAVVDASDVPELTFTEIGPVELKGVAGAMRLHSAHRT
ncbi:MAG: adenylate/guanylate cyclase domain-containing protein [Candidatus Limnocylindrales bacterium]